MTDPLAEKLRSIGQQQVLRFEPWLDTAARRQLRQQLESLDLDLIDQLANTYVKQRTAAAIPADIEPAPFYPRQPGAQHQQLYRDAHARGLELLSQGKVGAFLVAGGQGTRLGYDGPKGEFPVTPIRHKPLFQVFAEQLRAWSSQAARPVPWYVMTSDANDLATRAFFQKNGYFGYSADDVFFFRQGMMPAFDMDGRLLLGAMDSLALSPDGHGGSLRALHRSGALDDMQRRGVEHLSYFQVDNPLVHCIDPLFLGLHDLTGSEMSSKTIPKRSPTEKVGNFAIADYDGRRALQVIEYSDLPDELAHQKQPDGSLRFNAGSIAIHALRVSFIQRLNAGGRLKLPWHRAEKKVPFVNEQGSLVKPQSPNAVKLEQFVFDAIPLANNPIVYETDRAEEFSPVKNAQGEDSPQTSMRDQVRRAARWLSQAGVSVPQRDDQPDATLEISPLYAPTAEHLRPRKDLPRAIAHGAGVYLGPAGT